ncbi:KGK domain-containing protein [Oscillatoria salina]|uniref:KGK domain-containing protein n=1 Tax=Oscillatoria salina TaxID=331517 RepID=UPI0013BC7AB7|nr:KGK domain-containing protein [Oscillatoria salina]MBZ8180729.1 hypothetical protein [Oscillatoria salina IIICB1]NET87596.1 hypothetical protein [Kamptonema sp. SIO1D9]
MNDIFESLNCDEDVLKFGEDTFTVGKFKTLVAQDLHSRFNESTNNNRVDMKSFFAYIRLKTSQVSIPMDQTEFHFINKCQIIRINSSLPGWQKGRLKTRIVIDFTKSSQTNTYLEFCPDKPDETGLLLDEIR